MAASYELSNGKCYVDGVLQSTTERCDESIGWIMAILAIIFIPLLLFGIIFFGIWIWMLVHVIKNEDIKDRTVWLITMIASLPLGLFWLAAPVYYFAVKRPYDKQLKQKPPVDQKPPTS
jgi:uncharacterized protein YneF (UPF0154 family)